MHRRFVFLRDDDETGISGTGLVVMGVLYPDGRCHYRWMTEHQTDQMADSLDKLEIIHGHNGRTRIVFLDDETGQPYPGVLQQIQSLLGLTRWGDPNSDPLGDVRAAADRAGLGRLWESP